MFSLPNSLTLLRIGVIPLIVFLLYLPFAWAAWTALFFFILAGITDYLDGYFARSLNQTSDIGRFLDPIADKILVGTLLIVFAAVDRLDGIWVVPALVILVREFLVSGLREYLGPKNITLPVSKLAKWKTTFQMVALGFLLMGNYGDVLIPHTLFIGQLGLTVAAILTVITGWSYFRAGIVHMIKEER